MTMGKWQQSFNLLATNKLTHYLGLSNELPIKVESNENSDGLSKVGFEKSFIGHVQYCKNLKICHNNQIDNWFKRQYTRHWLDRVLCTQYTLY